MGVREHAFDPFLWGGLKMDCFASCEIFIEANFITNLIWNLGIYANTFT